MNTNDWLKRTTLNEFSFVRPVAVMKNGFEISIQASRCHYCSPREDNVQYYTHVEIGYPSHKCKTLAQYRDGGCDVYGYVPVDVVDRIIKRNGGIIQ